MMKLNCTKEKATNPNPQPAENQFKPAALLFFFQEDTEEEEWSP
jgi:hypothetical protein